MCQGPEVGPCLLCWRDVTEAGASGASEEERSNRENRSGSGRPGHTRSYSHSRLWLFL